jgi:hypothetical protein
MKGLLDMLMEATGTGPYAIKAIEQRELDRTGQQVNRKAKSYRLPQYLGNKKVPKDMRRLQDYLDSQKNKIGQ